MEKTKTRESFITLTLDTLWTADTTDGSTKPTKYSLPPSPARSRLAPTPATRTNEPGLAASSATFGAVAEKWKKQIRCAVGVNTYVKYETNYRLHLKPRLAMLPVHLAAARLQSLINAKAAEVSPATVRQIVLVARHILGLAVDCRLIAAIPPFRLPKPKRKAPSRLLSTQVPYLLQAAETSKYGFGLWIEMGTGIRRSEMLALEWADFDENYQLISVTKSVIRAQGRYYIKEKSNEAEIKHIDLPNAVADVLKRARAKSGLMFATKSGSYLSPANWQRLWQAWVCRANKLIAQRNESAGEKLALIGNVHFQDLRHLSDLDMLH